MKKQTAVEWLIEETQSADWWYLSLSMKQDILEQAKAMEKAQIINAVYYTCSAMSHSDLSCGEEYYQKKFKSE